MQFILKIIFFYVFLLSPVCAEVISIGDNLYIESWPNQRYSVYVQVNLKGNIRLPYYSKEIKVANLSLDSATKVLNKELGDLFRTYTFSVKFAGTSSQKVLIIGAVKEPGEYLIPSGARLSYLIKRLDLNAIKQSNVNHISLYDNTLSANKINSSDALDNELYSRNIDNFTSINNSSYSFGNSNDINYPANVSLREIYIQRKDTTFVCDLVKFFAEGDLSNNPVLLQDDVIRFVYKRKYIFFKGAFNQPGIYEIKNGENLREVVYLYGGLLPSADSNHIRIYNPKTRKYKIISIKADSNTILENLDHIYVPFKRDEVVVREAMIEGFVSRPGLYPIDSTTTLKKLILMAGGLKEEADILGVIIRRHIGTLKIPLPYDWKKDFINISIIRGDTISLDLKINDGDYIYVPEKKNVVYVSGYVGKPGSYPYMKGKSAKYYLNLAGGKNDFAYNEMIRVIRYKDGKILKVSKVSEIEPGDIIYVPEYVPFVNRPGWRIFKDVIFVLSAAVTILSSNFVGQLILGN